MLWSRFYQNVYPIRKPFGKGEDMVQRAEVVIPHTGFKVANKIKQIVMEIDDPFRIFFSFSMICLYG